MQPADLIAARNALGLSQEALGNHLGKTKQTINAWENGRAPIDSMVPRALNDLMRELNLTQSRAWLETTARHHAHFFRRFIESGQIHEAITHAAFTISAFLRGLDKDEQARALEIMAEQYRRDPRVAP